jgi:cell division septation protein DedD
MSKLFDALEKVAADRAALHHEPHDAGDRAPAPSSGTPIWRKASLVGIVVGVLVAAVSLPHLFERQQRSASLTPTVGEGQTVPHDAPSSASVAEAPFGPTAQPTLDSGGGIASETGTESRPTGESPGHVAATAPEPEAPDTIAAISDSIAPPTRRITFSVQVGAFKNRENAVRLQAQLAGRHHPATIHAGRAPGASCAVHVGRYLDRRAAEAARIALAREGFAGFVVLGENEGTARPSFAAGK